ncbi:Zinc-regulated transporter 1 [Mycena sanguinolenta]|uniref:Zinc-regulated transporter 1 n=1 Tax=Mycena sanguinolenta TaxID=230812 RepID=A0A8H6ZDT0_9AGAR|nr:Zinc-regulated transporter 1 [Mycena sanguinolenta]
MSTAISSPSYSSTPESSCLFAQDSGSHVSDLGLRVAALFIILVSSMLGAMLPVLLARHAQARSGICKVPRGWLNFAKHFGSGIILGTAFIHLLAPGIEALGNPCLSPGWRNYPYALGFCLSSILGIFVIEVVSMSYGSRRRSKSGSHPDTMMWGRLVLIHSICIQDCTNSRVLDMCLTESGAAEVERIGEDSSQTASEHAVTAVISAAILEFGAVLHSVLIGLTLAVSPKFKVLFAVLVTHQMFEGLGIGSRLASMHITARYPHLPMAGAVVFGLSTPLGMAVGLAMRTTYNEDDPGALVVSGVLDSLSSGILMYTALVELLGREILFNDELMTEHAKQLVSAVFWVLLGCGVMGLLGKWV